MTEIAPESLPEVLLITPKRFGDMGGYFIETYSQPRLAEAGFMGSFVQDNQSLSAARGTVRGLHSKLRPMLRPS